MDLEAMADALHHSGAYRILRRLEPLPKRTPPEGLHTRLGLFVDVETTGLNPTQDEIIELAMIPFTYGLDGQIYDTGEPFQQLRQPSRPISTEVTAITGIEDTMVAGKVISSEAVIAFAAPAALVIAHNAAFDRKFLERFCKSFDTKPWACSMSEIDWASEGFEGTKLSYLASGAGFFYERHRATHDCMAAIALLARAQPLSGRTGLSLLLERARTPSWRIWAENSPFELKEVLKTRGYRWNGDSNGAPRAWYIDVPEASRNSEVAFLQGEIYRSKIDLPMRRITAYERFSERC